MHEIEVNLYVINSQYNSFCFYNFIFLFKPPSTESFENAKTYCEKFRPCMPPHYNVRRQYDQPIPSLNATATNDIDANSGDDEFVETDADADDSVRMDNTQSTYVDNAASESIAAIDSLNASTTFDLDESARNDQQNSRNELVDNAQSTDVDNTVSGENTIAMMEQSVIVAESHNGDMNSGEAESNTGVEADKNVSQSIDGTGINVKHNLDPVNIHADDEIAIRSLFSDPKSNDASADSIAAVSLGSGETAKIKDGKIVVTQKLDDSMEMSYVYGETPTPLKPLYEIKINDLVSGNIPFKANEKMDRAYLVKIDNRFEEMKMASVLVNGLKCLNDGENRKQSGLDSAFIKALIIGLCTTKAIKNGVPIHKDLMIFIKGLNIFVNSLL